MEHIKQNLNPDLPDGSDPENPIKIYCDGVFDNFHHGHAILLQKVKTLFKHVHLTVGVCNDEDTVKHKGMPLLSYNERCAMVSYCKWVDAVVEAKWEVDLSFLDYIGVHYVAHDDIPYAVGDIADVYAEIKAARRFIVTTRTEGVSTTDIIDRVLRDYNIYVERSFKKEVDLTELNLPIHTFYELKLNNLADFITNGVLQLSKQVLEENKTSKPLLEEFVSKFET